jgi:hypothetical protein
MIDITVKISGFRIGVLRLFRRDITAEILKQQCNSSCIIATGNFAGFVKNCAICILFSKQEEFGRKKRSFSFR